MMTNAAYCCIKLSKRQKQSRKNNKIKPFMNQYNWNELDFPSHKKD